MRRSKILRLTGFAILGLAATLASGREGRAQYATSIPLDPWSSAYESYVYPIIPNNPAIPNAARYMERTGGPNQLNQYYGQVSNSMEEAMGSLPSNAPDVRGRMIPYTSGYRRFDREFGRVYQPNQNADAGYYQKRSERDDLYIRAMNARDPQKRAEAQRQLQAFDEKNQSLLGYSRRLEGGSARTAARRPAASRPPVPPTLARPSSAPAVAPATTAAEVANDEPIFAQAYGGVPTLHPYSSRVPVPRNFGFLNAKRATAPSGFGLGPRSRPVS